MAKRIESFLISHWAFLASFFVPVLVMGTIYAVQGVYPFGDSSLLTIDLGQQYIDFYSEYQHTLLEDPARLFYSFTKSLGGEMTGIWAYYLTSPLNLLFLLFPSYLLDMAVTVLTLLKIGLMGLSCSIFLHKSFGGKSVPLVLFSISYGLMGYVVVYQLNLMWLDGIFLLPLAALGVEYMLKNGNGVFYTFILALILFANYYIGYMICLFLVLYFMYRLPSAFWTSELKWDRMDKLMYALKKFALFAWHSLLGAGISAFLLVPTFFSLLASKAGYTNGTFDWELAYPMQEIVSKFMIGAFNFDQMPSGHPNLFVGSTALILFCLFFFNRSFPLKERILALVLTIFFLLSVNVEALNKIWHAMQFPVWFPYRFSFVFSFFMIVNGYRSMLAFHHLKLKGFLIGIAGILSVAGYVWYADFEFLDGIQIVVSSLFALSVLTLLFLNKKGFRWIVPLLLLFAMGELSANAAVSLSRLGYVKHSSFTYSQYLLDQLADPIRIQDDGLYRIEKTFHRSKNDSHQANYNSVTHFSSTYESDMPVMFGKLGMAAGNGFSVYSNGTLFTDAFFGIKYYLSDMATHSYPYYLLPPVDVLENWQTPAELEHKDRHDWIKPEKPENYSLDIVQTKPDVHYYPLLHSVENMVHVRMNPYALPVGFSSPEDVLDVPNYKNQPIQLQNALYQALLGKDEKLFVEEEFVAVDYTNVTVTGGAWSQKAEKNDPDAPASITFHLETEPLDAYYFTFHPSIKDDDVNLFLNGEPFYQYQTYYDQLVLNLAGRNGAGHVAFEIELEEDTLDLSGMQLYRLDYDQFASGMQEIQSHGVAIEEHGSTFIRASASVSADQDLVVFTIPYDKGWHIEANGQPVEPVKVLDSLIGVPLPEGSHQIEMRYRTPYLKEGFLISTASLACLAGTVVIRRKRVH